MSRNETPLRLRNRPAQSRLSRYPGKTRLCRQPPHRLFHPPQHRRRRHKQSRMRNLRRHPKSQYCAMAPPALLVAQLYLQRRHRAVSFLGLRPRVLAQLCPARSSHRERLLRMPRARLPPKAVGPLPACRQERRRRRQRHRLPPPHCQQRHKARLHRSLQAHLPQAVDGWRTSVTSDSKVRKAVGPSFASQIV